MKNTQTWDSAKDEATTIIQTLCNLTGFDYNSEKEEELAIDTIAAHLQEKYSKDNRSFSARKNTTLLLELNADSGYSSDEQHRVSPDQWHRISKILAEK